MIEVNRPILLTSIFLITLLVVACVPHSIGSSSKGPRTEDLIMYFYSDVNAAYSALKNGEIDIVGFDIQQPIYEDAITDPNIISAPVVDAGRYMLDINNNWTIPTYPGMRSPTNYQSFRQALAFLVDKNYIVETICSGFARRLDQPLSYAMHMWHNQSYMPPNYPYEFDPDAAATLLDSADFTQGTTPNPHYNASVSWSAQYLRTYPSDHNLKPDETLDPLIVFVRTDDPRRMGATRLLCDNLRTIGVPVQQNEGPSVYCYDPVMGQRDYHVYLGGWSGGRFPTSVYHLFHSSFNVPYGTNYVTGFEADGSPNHPELDDLLYNIYYADFFEEALTSCRNAMGLFTELCVNIPIFSAKAFWVYSSELLGTVNQDNYAYDQERFFLNAYKTDESPIRWGTIKPPNALNILYSSWTYDYQCLERVYDYGDFDRPPYNIAADQPGFVLDWYADIWDDNGTIKAKNHRLFRSDNYFCDTNGNQLGNVDADDYLFSNYVIYAIGSWDWQSWHWSTVQDLKFFNKVNDTFVEIYFNERSLWLYTAASPPLLPMSIWLNTSYGLTEQIVENYVVGTNLTTPGFMCLGGAKPHGPCWVNSVTSDLDGALTEWVDFHWELGDWYLTTPLTSGAVVTVDYYAINDTIGHTLGNNSWQDVTIGSGMYYATSYTPGVGGNFTAQRNPYYYLETPILGEVDFVWEEGGYYEITIFDVVMAASAYGSQGIAVPDENWFPGADLAPPGGVIDIFDIVTIASAYGETFGAPPP